MLADAYAVSSELRLICNEEQIDINRVSTHVAFAAVKSFENLITFLELEFETNVVVA
jgi:hypothetical protein